MDGREVESLIELGLTRYESAAYVALTRRGRATGAEVAQLARLPRQRIYDVLHSLVAHGLASVEPGRPTHFAALPPEDAVATLLASHRSRIERLESEAASIVERLSPAYRQARSLDDPLSYIEVLREPTAIATRFTELEASADQEILIFTKAPYALDAAQNVRGLELLRRKIEARSIYERSMLDDPAMVETVRRFVAAGEQARIVDQLPLKLVLIDERFSLFTMEDPVAGTPELTIMVVEHPPLARLLKLAFDHIWAEGEPFA
jgi:sugar-specific transcriptional regulator TrmB